MINVKLSFQLLDIISNQIPSRTQNHPFRIQDSVKYSRQREYVTNNGSHPLRPATFDVRSSYQIFRE